MNYYFIDEETVLQERKEYAKISQAVFGGNRNKTLVKKSFRFFLRFPLTFGKMKRPDIMRASKLSYK